MIQKINKLKGTLIPYIAKYVINYMYCKSKKFIVNSVQSKAVI